jgi:hypothetical protein
MNEILHKKVFPSFEGGVVGMIDYLIYTVFYFPTGVVDSLNPCECIGFASSPASRDQFFCLFSFICSFLLLAQKKGTKEKGSLKSFLGLPFLRLPTHYNSPSLHSGSNSNAYLKLSLRHLKNVNLFPKKIWRHCSPYGDLN